MNLANKQYNYCLDFIKGIACIFVVFLHCEFPGTTGVVVQAFSRYCVPFFFMVSGYYYCNEKTLEKTERKRKAIHIGRITAWATLFYILFGCIQFFVLYDISLTFSLKDIVAFLFCNQMFFIVSQMWFLYALLYVYVVLVFLNPDWFRNHCLQIATVCLLFYVCLAQGLHLAGIRVPNCVYKNWLIEGFGFFALGFSLHLFGEKISLNNKSLLWIIAITTVLSIAERYLLGRDFGVNICSIPQATALMLYAINNPDRQQGAIQRLGRDCSMMVYILHPAVWHTIDGIYKVLGITCNMPAQYIKPIIVACLSIIGALAFNFIVSTFQNKRVATTTV